MYRVIVSKPANQRAVVEIITLFYLSSDRTQAKSLSTFIQLGVKRGITDLINPIDQRLEEGLSAIKLQVLR
jgi:hypothetical protein